MSRTLRERGHTACEHPEAIVEVTTYSFRLGVGDAIGLIEHRFCPSCGARLLDGVWKGGSLDFDAGASRRQWGSLLRWWEAEGS